MTTATYHRSNLGSYAPAGLLTDMAGFVTYHKAERYAKASDEQLAKWAGSRIKAVRTAALPEQAERGLRQWQRGDA